MLLGPEGDLLQVAKYLPSAVLPNRFTTATRRRSPTPSSRIDATAGDDDRPTSRPQRRRTAANVAEPDLRRRNTDETEPLSRRHEPAGDERYGTEPAPLDEPAAEPIAEEKPRSPAVAPLPLHGPTFTVDQLATALEAGKAAQAGLMTGDLSDAAVRRTKGMSYAKLVRSGRGADVRRSLVAVG